MKLKYYLRGLGTGIFVSTLILSIAFEVRMSKMDTLNRSMPEEESSIQTESVTSADTKDTEKSTTEKTTTEEDTRESTTQEVTTKEEEIETTSEKWNVTETEISTLNPSSAEVTIDIYSGMSSNKVAARLEELGVIEDAEDFNEYIYENHVENRIRTGKFDISQDATYEDIVSIITGG